MAQFGQDGVSGLLRGVDRRVREAAQFVGLREDMLEKSPFELSGGQKRRVAIAGVIAICLLYTSDAADEL